MATETIEILGTDDLRRTLTRLACQIIEKAKGRLGDVVLLGIHTRGIPLAHQLARQIEQLENMTLPVGELDITFYRDDLDRIGPRTPQRTQIPVDLSGKLVLLVDDVIFSGRTIRAALNAIHDYGRPQLTWLLVLVDRGHRELPIHPDFIGKTLPTAREEVVKVWLQATDGRDAVELIKP